MTRLFAGTPFDIPPSCDDCGKLESQCVCTPQQKKQAAEQRQRLADRLPPEQQAAIIRTEKRKAGRIVTVIRGLSSRANDLTSILANLKSGCGAGGTVKGEDDQIEIQGDHVSSVAKTLRQMGYRVKT